MFLERRRLGCGIRMFLTRKPVEYFAECNFKTSWKLRRNAVEVFFKHALDFDKDVLSTVEIKFKHRGRHYNQFHTFGVVGALSYYHSSTSLYLQSPVVHHLCVNSSDRCLKYILF